MSTIAVLDGNGDPQTIAAVDTTGQAAEADCLPVVLPAAQITTLTPPAAITGFATETTLDDVKTAVEAIAVDPATATLQAAILAALGSPFQAGGSIANTTFAVTGTFWQATQPVSGTFWQATQPVSVSSLPLPSGAATDTLQGALTETAPASDTASSGLNGRMQRIAQRISSLMGQLPAALGITTAANSLSIAPASDATFALTSTGYNSAIDVTRPANQTPYGAGDVVGGAIAFTSAGPTAGHVIINTAELRYDVSAIPSGMTAFRLHLYNVTPPSAYADNAVWDLASGDRASYLGYIDLGGIVDLGSTLHVQFDSPGKQVKLAASETALYGYLVTVGAYTPAANSETLRVTLRTAGL